MAGRHDEPCRLLILAACVGVLLATPVPGAAAEIMIDAAALTPALLTVESDESVTFVNRSGRVVHLEFRGRADEHQVFQVPGRIRATFHRAGRHPYLSDASRSLAFCLRGTSQDDDDVYVMINAHWETLDFTVQDGAPAEWRRVVDTGRESPDDIREPEQEVLETSARYTVGPRSVVVVVRRRRS